MVSSRILVCQMSLFLRDRKMLKDKFRVNLAKKGKKAFNLIILQRKENQIKPELLTVSVRIFNELYWVLLSLHTSSESLKLLSSKQPFPGHSTSMLTKLRLQARSCMRPLTICNTLSGSQVWFAERGGNICKNNWVLGTYKKTQWKNDLPTYNMKMILVEAVC